VVGATANQNLFLAIHEISHNLAFRSPLANRILAIFANLPIGLPYSAAFRVSLPSKDGPRAINLASMILTSHSPTTSPTTNPSA
jgi:sphingolipid 4-desaturase/C4-monooxygenase